MSGISPDGGGPPPGHDLVRLALLKTRCGCERTIEISGNHEPHRYEVPTDDGGLRVFERRGWIDGVIVYRETRTETRIGSALACGHPAYCDDSYGGCTACAAIKDEVERARAGPLIDEAKQVLRPLRRDTALIRGRRRIG